MNLQPGGGGGFFSEEHKQKFLLAGTQAPGRIQKSIERVKWLYENDPEWSKHMRSQIGKGHKGNQVWLGRKHSEETKKKISESNKGKGVGSNNSQFGTMWITNGINNRKIKKSDSIPNGWQKGRTF